MVHRKSLYSGETKIHQRNQPHSFDQKLQSLQFPRVERLQDRIQKIRLFVLCDNSRQRRQRTFSTRTNTLHSGSTGQVLQQCLRIGLDFQLPQSILHFGRDFDGRAHSRDLQKCYNKVSQRIGKFDRVLERLQIQLINKY